MKKIPVILDCDPGVDDIAAIILAKNIGHFDIKAVTTVAGNVELASCTKNGLEVLDFLGWDVPLAEGAAKPLTLELVTAAHIHGASGMGGLSLPSTTKKPITKPAWDVIYDIACEHKGELEIVAVGPLTNIARAFKRDPDLPQLVENLYISGGTIDAPGNITATAEFNIFCDPVSARYVLQAPCHKLLVPLDVTNRTLFTLTHFGMLPDESKKIGSLLRNILLPAFRAYRQCYGIEGIHINDLIAFMAALHPECALQKSLPVDVETEGNLTKGMTVFDRRNRPDFRNLVEVVIRLDGDAILQNVFARLANIDV